MSVQFDALKLCWERDDLTEFFRYFLHLIQDKSLKDDEVEIFLKKLQNSYPIPTVMEFKQKYAKEIKKVLEIEITDSSQYIERKVATHFLKYKFKEVLDDSP